MSVRSGRNIVANLSAADFELLDNGVLQDVQQIEIGAVPLDVTLVLDTGEAGTVGPEGRVMGVAQGSPQAEADMLAGGAAEGEFEPGESLQEAESELGISEWIDPDSGVPAEDNVPRLEDH